MQALAVFEGLVFANVLKNNNIIIVTKEKKKSKKLKAIYKLDYCFL